MKKILTSWLIILLILSTSIAMGATKYIDMGATKSEQIGMTCQILDNPLKPAYQVGIGYVMESRFKGDAGEYGKSAFLEINSDWAFAYFRNILYGNIDLNLQTRSILFMG